MNNIQEILEKLKQGTVTEEEKSALYKEVNPQLQELNKIMEEIKDAMKE